MIVGCGADIVVEVRRRFVRPLWYGVIEGRLSVCGSCSGGRNRCGRRIQRRCVIRKRSGRGYGKKKGVITVL